MRMLRLLIFCLLLSGLALFTAACQSADTQDAGNSSVPVADPGVAPATDSPVAPSASAAPVPGSPSAGFFPAGEWKRAELPYDYAAMKEDVRIQLDEEPQLYSPLRTVVGDAPQAYTFFFREPMDRASVEEAIRRHAKDATDAAMPFTEPVLSFHWSSDRQLHVLAALLNPPQPDGEWTEYVLNAGGARTAAGQPVGEEFAFRAVAFPPAQVWRLSLDGSRQEKLTAFAAPYSVVAALGDDRRFLLLYRFREYCECDARHIPLYALYDLERQKLIRYPLELVQSYRGAGSFVADRRGFFYAAPEAGLRVPASAWAVSVKVDGFVHGADFSRDRRYVLMAVGEAGQKRDLDLVIADLETGGQRRLPGAIQGTIPTSEADGAVLPVSFTDAGRYATFMMRASEESLVEIRQRYDWTTGKVSSWDPPVSADVWSGYSQSDDGKYQLYWNGGLYRGTEKIREFDQQGIWVPGTHLLAYAKWENETKDGPGTESLRLHDADTGQERVLREGLPVEVSVFAASRDGKWLLVQTRQEPRP